MQLIQWPGSIEKEDMEKQPRGKQLHALPENLDLIPTPTQRLVSSVISGDRALTPSSGLYRALHAHGT